MSVNGWKCGGWPVTAEQVDDNVIQGDAMSEEKGDELSVRRVAKVDNMATGDEAVAAVAKVIRKGDPHPDAPLLKAYHPVVIARLGKTKWEVAVYYKCEEKVDDE